MLLPYKSNAHLCCGARNLQWEHLRSSKNISSSFVMQMCGDPMAISQMKFTNFEFSKYIHIYLYAKVYITMRSSNAILCPRQINIIKPTNILIRELKLTNTTHTPRVPYHYNKIRVRYCCNGLKCIYKLFKI